MFNDSDRLQQLEDRWNAGDSVYAALGIQQQIMRKLAQFRDQQDGRDPYEAALEYYLDEGYPLEEAEEMAAAEVEIERTDD